MEHSLLTKEEFDQHIRESDLPIVADFWAPWCGSCRLLAPAVKRLAENMVDTVRVLMVNVEESPDIAEAHDVMSLPTILIFRNGSEISRLNGSRSYDALTTEVTKAVN